MENFYIALVTFFSVANLTCVFKLGRYPKQVAWPFIFLNISIILAIVFVSAVSYCGSVSHDKTLFIYVIGNTWYYPIFMVIVQLFCFKLANGLVKIKQEGL